MKSLELVDHHRSMNRKTVLFQYSQKTRTIENRINFNLAECKKSALKVLYFYKIAIDLRTFVTCIKKIDIHSYISFH